MGTKKGIRKSLDNPAKIPRLKFSFVIKISVLIVLSGITLHGVYIGPIRDLERNSTQFRKNYLNVEGTLIAYLYYLLVI